MSISILKAQNGELLFSNEKWCRVSTIINNKKTDHGCEERNLLFSKFLVALTDSYQNTPLIEIISGEPYRYVCGLSDPYTAVNFSCNKNKNRKLLIVPNEARFSAYIDDNGRKCCEFNSSESKKKPDILILSEKDRIAWINEINAIGIHL